MSQNLNVFGPESLIHSSHTEKNTFEDKMPQFDSYFLIISNYILCTIIKLNSFDSNLTLMQLALRNRN